MKQRLFLGAALGAIAAANPALAADLPVKAPVYAPPVYTWTGCYIGGNVGYSWGRSSGDINTPDLINRAIIPPIPTLFSISSDPQGVIGGAQVGCRRQVDNRWVLGIETDIQGSGQKASRSFGAFNSFGEGFAGTAEAKLKWFGTVRAVGGVLVAPTVLLYATGGLAYGEASVSSTIVGTSLPLTGFGNTAISSFSNSKVTAGWTVGAGIEAAILDSPNWTWKLEYLYMDLGSINGAGIDPVIGSYRWGANIKDNIVRIGVNYRFGDWGMTPVVAKY